MSSRGSSQAGIDSECFQLKLSSQSLSCKDTYILVYWCGLTAVKRLDIVAPLL
jgi:hypothetical protein